MIAPIGNKFAQFARKAVNTMTKSGDLAPVIALEAVVVSGRTYQAHKRGGKKESRERFTEEIIGSIVWLGGVKGFNAVGDWLGRKLFKLANTNVDAGSDIMRKPLERYMREGAKGLAKLTQKQIEIFKACKVLTSVLLANLIIGFIVPPINQAITNRKKAKEAEAKLPDYKLFLENANLTSFAAKNKVQNDEAKDEKVTFKGGMNAFTHFIESNDIGKLLSTDVGVIAGRTYNARNITERIEIAFRDISSIFFYMFAGPLICKLLNKIQIGTTSRLDSISADKIAQDMKAFLDSKGKTSATLEEFIGKDKVNIPNNLRFVEETRPSWFDRIFRRNSFKPTRITTLEEFEKVESNPTIREIARKMAKIQPETERGLILSEKQVKDIYRGGFLNNPEKLKEYFDLYTDGVASGSAVDKYGRKIYGFVSHKKLEAQKKDIIKYIKDMSKNGEKPITKEIIDAANKKNLIANGANYLAGFLVCGAFLSTIIPKIQYYITKKTTGEDGFPGVK